MSRRPVARSKAWLRVVAAGMAGALAVAAPGATAPDGRAHQAAAPVALVASSPSPGHEADFVGRINSLRASKGLSTLQASGDLLGVARRWTERMAQAGDISHNPNLASEVPGAWTKLGENVGVGNDVGGLMQAFINSPTHYQNLVDPDWTHVAVGVTLANGRMWTTHNFMVLESAPPPPPPPPPPPTTAPPAPDPPPSRGPGGSGDAGSGTGGSDSGATDGGGPTEGDGSSDPSAGPGSGVGEAGPGGVGATGDAPSAERVAAVLAPLRTLES